MIDPATSDIVFLATGDVGPERSNPESIFRHVKEALSHSDIAFTQLEVNLSRRPSGGWQAHENARDPQIAAAIRDAGFKVVSFAGNHCLDAGIDAFFDTIDNLQSQKLAVIGVGRNIEEARKPAIIECKGTRTAFLAYNSVLKPGYWAESNRPGCAPIRATTSYESIDPYQPGTQCRIRTYCDKDDLKMMGDDIKKARARADLVVVSMHCGIHMTPAVVAEYQTEMAHSAIDAGADLILQHHAHILKGIEIYNGKVIFYGLGNFAIEIHFMTKEWAQSPSGKEEIKSFNPDWNPPYPDYPSFPFPPDSRKTIIAKCIISHKAIKKVSFIPTIINKQAEPEILTSGDKRFREIFKYMEDITRDQGLKTIYSIEGDEVIVQK